MLKYGQFTIWSRNVLHLLYIWVTRLWISADTLRNLSGCLPESSKTHLTSERKQFPTFILTQIFVYTLVFQLTQICVSELGHMGHITILQYSTSKSSSQMSKSTILLPHCLIMQNLLASISENYMNIKQNGGEKCWIVFLLMLVVSFKFLERQYVNLAGTI